MKYNYTVFVKSGVGGYFDAGGCNLLIKEINSNFLPRKDEIISIYEELESNGKACEMPVKYLVQEVEYWYKNESENGIKVYVIPVGSIR